MSKVNTGLYKYTQAGRETDNLLCMALSWSSSPDTDVNWTSEIDPMYSSEAKLTTPLGVHPTKISWYYDVCSQTRLMTVTVNRSESQQLPR